MTIYYWDTTSAYPGSYTSPSLALSAARAAGGAGHHITAARDGDSVANQVLNCYGTTGFVFDALSGVRARIGLHTSMYSGIDAGAGTIFDCAGRLTLAASHNYPIIIRAGSSLTVRDAEVRVISGAVFKSVSYIIGAAGAITWERCVFTPDTVPVTWFGACQSQPGTGNVATVTMEDCAVTIGFTFIASTGLVSLFSSPGLTTVRVTRAGVAKAAADASPNLVYVDTGRTLHSLTMQACYGRVSNLGTITTFAGGYNAYTSTSAGTSDPTDRIVTDYRLGGHDGLEPLPDSPLRTIITSGLAVGGGSSAVDVYANPRWRGGRQCVGPVQPQRIEMPMPVRVAASA